MGEFSMVYKKLGALLWLRVYKVCLDIPDVLLTIRFRRMFCDMQISQIS